MKRNKRIFHVLARGFIDALINSQIFVHAGFNEALTDVYPRSIRSTLEKCERSKIAFQCVFFSFSFSLAFCWGRRLDLLNILIGISAQEANERHVIEFIGHLPKLNVSLPSLRSSAITKAYEPLIIS